MKQVVIFLLCYLFLDGCQQISTLDNRQEKNFCEEKFYFERI